MKISVIIPAHNEEKNIEATLRAIIAQTYPDFEVIVVDNASSDATARIVTLFPSIKVVNERRKGTMWACERGRAEATGEIIVRMDADCLPETDWLARGAIHFTDPKVSAVTGPYDYYDGTKIFRSTSLFTQKYIYWIANHLLQFFKIGAIIIGGNSFMRAEALTKMGGFKTSIVFFGDDSDTAKSLSKYGRVVFDRHLVIMTSARRFKAEGALHLMLKYWYFFFKTIFRRRQN